MQRTSNVLARVESKINEQAKRQPVAMGALTSAQLNTELEKGYADAVSGRHRSFKNVVAEIERDYGI